VCDDDVCLDIRAAGFWGTRQQNAFFDVHVFNPLDPRWSTVVLLLSFFQLQVE